MKLKYLRKVYIIFIFLLVSILLVINLDLKEKNKFINLNNYNRATLTIDYNQKYNNDNFYKLITLSQKYNILLTKIETRYQDQKLTNLIYVSIDVQDALKLMNLKYEVLSNKTEDSSNIYAATKKSNDKLLKYKLDDILHNDNFAIFSFKKLIDNQGYLFSDYQIFYENEQEYIEYINQIKEIFGDDLKVNIQDQNIQSSNEILISLLILIIAGLFYLIIEVFSIYNISKKLVIMKLLGFSNFMILKKVVKKDVNFYISLSILLIIIDFIIIPYKANIFSFIIIYVLIILIFLGLSYLSIYIICYKKSMIELLKNKLIISKLIKLCGAFKIIINSLFIIILMITLTTSSSYFNKLEELHNMKEIINYAFFAQINEHNEQYNEIDRSNLNRLYKLLEDTDLNYIYAEFSQYRLLDKEDLKRTNKAIKKGSYIPFATVDLNYLKKNNIKIYDQKGKEVEIKANNFEIFVFPEKYKDYYEKFIRYYKTSLERYGINNINSNYDFYMYKDTELLKYSSNEDGSNVVKSNILIDIPILRVTYSNFPINYLDYMIGLNVGGTSKTTSLKIDTEIDKNNTYNQLLPLLIENNIDKIFTLQTFVTMGELIGEDINNYQNIIYAESIMLIFVIIIYIVLTFETNYLMIEKEKSKICTKIFMGFSKVRVYRGIYYFNICSILVPIILLNIIMILIGWGFNLNLLLSLILLIIFENIVFIISCNKINLDNIICLLKGE